MFATYSQLLNLISFCNDFFFFFFWSVARFDFSWGDAEFHQETVENLKVAVKSTKKLCAVSLPFWTAHEWWLIIDYYCKNLFHYSPHVQAH